MGETASADANRRRVRGKTQRGFRRHIRMTDADEKDPRGVGGGSGDRARRPQWRYRCLRYNLTQRIQHLALSFSEALSLKAHGRHTVFFLWRGILSRACW